jgi:N-acetylmuramoyl-L-alanine amidase
VYAGTMSRDELHSALDRVYAGTEAWQGVLQSRPGRLDVRTHAAQATVQVQRISLAANAAEASAHPPARYWRPAASLPAVSLAEVAERPLTGVHVALDPGHIGGQWAKMEERWYQLKGHPLEVKEGELSLAVAQRLKIELEALGARISLVRETTEPVTPRRAADFRKMATTQRGAELLFYRQSEIRARADLVNNRIRPDLCICLHLNAEAWGEPTAPQLTSANHLHMLMNGHYSAEELALDDCRYEMLRRLFQRTADEELPLNLAVATGLAEATGLPAYDYDRGHMSGNAHRPASGDAGRYVWVRNLLANRLYECPVIYCEPYVMNCEDVYTRLCEGDYEGTRLVAGRPRPSLIREYARGVATGLAAYFRHVRMPHPRPGVNNP